MSEVDYHLVDLGDRRVLTVDGRQHVTTYSERVVRMLMGVTDPKEAAPGTIRGDLGIELTENLVHGSDSPESAARELALFFPDL